MPATEQTCYNMRRLHKVFAVSSVLLTLATIWMFARDHYREWKTIQRTSDRIEMQLTRWQKLQSLSEDVVASVSGLSSRSPRRWHGRFRRS